MKYQNGALCGDEPYQIAKKTAKNIVVITCKDRLQACNTAINNYGCEVIIMDDGFSNRKVKKDKTIIVMDSVMKFGNSHLLPYGPLREPVSEIKRANEIYIVNKEGKDIKAIIDELKPYNKKMYECKMLPNRFYNMQTLADIKPNTKEKENAVAFCAIGQPVQFYNYLNNFYNIFPVTFEDHHKYSNKDINYLKKTADANGTNILITTQKDESKIKELIHNSISYSFNVLELSNLIEEIN